MTEREMMQGECSAHDPDLRAVVICATASGGSAYIARTELAYFTSMEAVQAAAETLNASAPLGITYEIERRNPTTRR